jgi:hypothetical protein
VITAETYDLLKPPLPVLQEGETSRVVGIHQKQRIGADMVLEVLIDRGRVLEAALVDRHERDADVVQYVVQVVEAGLDQGHREAVVLEVHTGDERRYRRGVRKQRPIGLQRGRLVVKAKEGFDERSLALDLQRLLRGIPQFGQLLDDDALRVGLALMRVRVREVEGLRQSDDLVLCEVHGPGNRRVDTALAHRTFHAKRHRSPSRPPTGEWSADDVIAHSRSFHHKHERRITCHAA